MEYYQTALPEEQPRYDHKRTEELLNGARNLLKSKMKILVPEWKNEIAESEEVNNALSAALIEQFYIAPANVAPFENLNGISDVARLFDSFVDWILDVEDQLDAIEDNNAGLDADIKNTIQAYGKVFDKAEQVFSNRCKKETSKLKELSTVDEIKDGVAQFLGTIVSDYIIIPIVEPLYESIENNEVYPLILNELNGFLQKVGIYTVQISAGDPVNPDMIEPTEDSATNYTEDFNKVDTIDEVRRYPYYFSNGIKVVDGKAKIFRRK